MIRLDATTRKLQAVLGGAITTNQLPITVCYSDKTSTAYTGGTTVINTNNTTAVDICAAPAASTVRDVDTINVNNADTVAATITIRYNDNGTTYTLFKATLAVGDQLTYVHGVGWNVIDSTGKTKVGAGVNGPSSSTDNALVRWDGTAGTAIQNSGWTLSDTDALNGVSGSVGAPSLTLNGETTSGLYRIGANNHGWAISGAKVLDISSAGLGVTGTFTSSGNAGIGVASNAARALEVGSTSLTGTTQIGAAIFPTFSSGATSSVRGVNVSLTLADASYTVTNLYGLLVAPTSGGAGATVTQEYGIDIGALTKGATTVGLRSQVAAATNFWNLYISGTAQNAFAGNVRIGSTTAPTNALDVTGNATVSGQTALGGAAIVNYTEHRVSNTFTSGGASTVAIGFGLEGTITSAAGDTTYVTHFQALPSGTITNGTGEVHSLITTARFTEPVITLTGADTVTTAATVYIASAPTEGADNYALVANGGVLIGTTTGGGNHTKHFISNTFTSGGASTVAYGTRITGTVTAAAGDTTRHASFLVNPTSMVTQGATEAITLVASAYFTEPVITVGAGDTITTAATIYIADAPTEGATNAALYVASGATVLQNTWIGDTSNANMTLGLTINQGANDNEILSLKSSDVAHGMTSVTETDTYGYISKFSATDGGAFFDGLADTGATGLRLRGVMVTANTTKTTGGLAAVMIDSALKSTTTVASSGADANMVAFRDNGTTRFILDADGDSHQDVGTAWTNFDHLDDVATLDALAYNVARPDDPIKRKFGEFLADKREVLEQQRIVKFNDDGHHFVNMSKLTMLHTGAIRQIGEKLEMAERVIERLSNQLQRLEMNHANPNH